ncbi:flavodoxin family protein [Marinisporobacter balticus]|uniref:NADPH-dependent FMN reductase n=1 Tax=Marinisporobacter balticus TaxID=2018667 RepID=A0A4R2LJ12_9FIRM|nr:flavodoxin family protein [Marinisporobacter balticus]TCO79345.1 NADPH-dependent FMN reductase [Marinisporobacter balticus]
MKALAILGSPREKMNTDILLNSVIQGLEQNQVEVEKIELSKANIAHCIACNVCSKEGSCFMNDDMYKMYGKFDQADIVVVASPLYFNSVTSITKTMIDRCQMFWSSKYVLNKPSIDRYKKRNGMFICTAGGDQKENNFIGATRVMDLFFKAINTQYNYNLLVDHTDKLFVGNRVDILERALKMAGALTNF